MKRFHLFFAVVLLFSFFAMYSTVFAQNEPVMYFCEKYGRNGEEGVSDRFTTGYLTVVVKSDYALRLDMLQFSWINIISAMVSLNTIKSLTTRLNRIWNMFTSLKMMRAIWSLKTPDFTVFSSLMIAIIRLQVHWSKLFAKCKWNDHFRRAVLITALFL